MKKAISYIRVSTTSQHIERQQNKFKDYCTLNNLNPVGEIVDFGISGAKSDREGYLKLQQLTSKDADIVVVSELSRLSRQEEILETVNKIQSIVLNGISLVFLDDSNKTYEANKPLDLTELIILLVGAFRAAQERREIKRKNQEGKQAILRDNPYAVVDAKVPFGYKGIYNPNGSRPKKILVENEEEIAYIKKIYAMVLEGGTLGTIQRYFSNRNIKFRGHFVDRNLLSVLLSNVLYKGIRRRTQRFDREVPDVVEVRITPIVSESDWDKANEMISNNQCQISTGNNYYNPLKGIIRCRCGRAMMVKDKGKDKNGRIKKVYRCSDNSIKADPVHCTYNADEISYHLTNETLFALLKFINSNEQNIMLEQTENKIQEIQEELDGSKQIIQSKQIEIKQLNEQNQILVERYINATSQTIANAIQVKQIELENNIKAKTKQINDLNQKIIQLQIKIDILKRSNNDEILNNLTLEEKSSLFRKYLKEVNYISVTLMQGFYSVKFHSGYHTYVAIRKTARSPIVAVLPNGYTIDEKTKEIIESYDYGNIHNIQGRRISIQEYFNTDIVKNNLVTLDIDYSWRNPKQ